MSGGDERSVRRAIYRAVRESGRQGKKRLLSWINRTTDIDWTRQDEDWARAFASVLKEHRGPREAELWFLLWSSQHSSERRRGAVEQIGRLAGDDTLSAAVSEPLRERLVRAATEAETARREVREAEEARDRAEAALQAARSRASNDQLSAQLADEAYRELCEPLRAAVSVLEVEVETFVHHK